MEVMIENCCGIDVHQKVLAVCVLCGPVSSAKPQKQAWSCGTTTSELKELGERLRAQSISTVMMESTGQYWCPVWNVLEEFGFELVLANPQRVKGIPGRKTDQNDAEWLTELGRMGLVPKSYMPPKAIQDFRKLTRTKSHLLRERTQHRNRIHNVLQQANIKLTSYLSDVFGVTGKLLLQCLINGEVMTLERVKECMVTGRGRRFKCTAEQLLLALDGSFSKIHLEELDVHLNIIESLDCEITRLEQSIEDYTSVYQETYEKLLLIPGVGHGCATVVLAEIGENVEAFPDAQHLASWAGVCPGSYESAGKRKSSHITHGNKYLKEALYHAGRTASHSKSPSFSDYYARIAHKGSKQKAVIAVANKVLRVIYKVLDEGIIYQER